MEISWRSRDLRSSYSWPTSLGTVGRPFFHRGRREPWADFVEALQLALERTSMLFTLRMALQLLNEEKVVTLCGISHVGGREQSFLSRHPFLYSVINEAKSQISKYFGDASISLRAYTYHDEPHEEELVVYIHTSLSVEDAMKRLDSLIEEWWIDNLDQARGKLGFDLYFK